jgi:hypothetical protein
MPHTPFPAVGHVYEANFGSWVHYLHFESETVQIEVTLIRQGIFMVSWQEADQTTVVHVEDYENGIVHTNVTKPRGGFLRNSGTLKKVE